MKDVAAKIWPLTKIIKLQQIFINIDFVKVAWYLCHLEGVTSIQGIFTFHHEKPKQKVEN